MANYPLDKLLPCEFQPGDKIEYTDRSSLLYGYRGVVVEVKRHQMASNDNWYWVVWSDIYDKDLKATYRYGPLPEQIKKIR